MGNKNHDNDEFSIFCINFDFRVSPNNAMKNLKNNFCIHPKGGWPKEGVYLVYYKGCGGDRLRFNFFDLG